MFDYLLDEKVEMPESMKKKMKGMKWKERKMKKENKNEIQGNAMGMKRTCNGNERDMNGA